FFPLADFWRFAVLAGSGAFVAGARFGVELLLLLLLMRAMVVPRTHAGTRDLLQIALLGMVAFSVFTVFSWQWYEVASIVVFLLILRVVWGWKDDARRVLILAMLPGMYVWGRTRDILLSAMRDEIAALDF